MIRFIRVLNCLEEAKDLEICLREEKGLNNFLKIFVRIVRFAIELKNL